MNEQKELRLREAAREMEAKHAELARQERLLDEYARRMRGSWTGGELVSGSMIVTAMKLAETTRRHGEKLAKSAETVRERLEVNQAIISGLEKKIIRLNEGKAQDIKKAESNLMRKEMDEQIDLRVSRARSKGG
ncbi:hypothetical protein [Acidocella sp.]|uniref:hypothetical protein n=1 Tax=Acidocella sp. TaxID=50710 RepID=UPI00261378AC|nr:hypothetical protein [Acidocella sp.]